LEVLAPITGARMGTCKAKGFDAVEPDNMDGYQNRTGFRVTYAQQLRYDTFLAEAAHERGLAIAMKNGPEQVEDLVDLYDFAITEDCFEWNWCGEVSPFVSQNKAVLAAEYTDTGAKLSRFYPKAESLRFDAILKKRNLGAWRRSCWTPGLNSRVFRKPRKARR
jgi:Glycoside-hydrolase family GH114